MDNAITEEPLYLRYYPKTVEEIALWCAFASAVAVIFSIALSQILLGGALLALLVGRQRLRFPRIALPLGLFLLGTIISFVFSPDKGVGMSQIKKIFVYATLPVVFTTLRTPLRAARFYLSVMGASAGMATLGVAQFIHKVQQAHAAGKNFYEFYVPFRITGLMSHWMTFSGQEMYGLVIAAAWIFFAPKAKRLGWVPVLSIAVIGMALVLSDTRNIWIAAFFALLYLLWFWRRLFAILLPVAVTVGILLAPSAMQERVISIVRPHGDSDSNMHRIICWRTGLRMIEAHPLLGLGPDAQRLHFYDYVPEDVSWPLPTGFYGHLHNIYIQYAADRGILTMLMLVWMLIQIIVDSLRTLRKLPPGRSISRFILQAAVACTIGSMISGIFEYNLNDSEVLALFLAIAGCAAIVTDGAIDGTNDVEPARA